MNSNHAFSAVEKQANKTLSYLLRYLRGPKFLKDNGISKDEVWMLVGCIIATIAYTFTVQAEFFVAMAVMVDVFGKEGWRVGAFSIIGAGLISSFIVSEWIPFTRLLTKTSEDVAPDRMETLVGQVLGVKNRDKYEQSRIGYLAIGFILLMTTAISFFSIQQAIDTGNWKPVVFPPLLFLLDTLFGIGPFWLLVFTIKKVGILWRNWRAQGNYSRVEEAWNLVSELYGVAKAWYVQEHPEMEQQQDRLPTVSPLAGFIITHPCHEDIEIPEHILKPSTAQHKTNKKPPENGRHSPKKNESLDNPADLFSAMDSDSEIDSDSEANDVTI